jgi:hypothetical protein
VLFAAVDGAVRDKDAERIKVFTLSPYPVIFNLSTAVQHLDKCMVHHKVPFTHACINDIHAALNVADTIQKEYVFYFPRKCRASSLIFFIPDTFEPLRNLSPRILSLIYRQLFIVFVIIEIIYVRGRLGAEPSLDERVSSSSSSRDRFLVDDVVAEEEEDEDEDEDEADDNLAAAAAKLEACLPVISSCRCC